MKKRTPIRKLALSLPLVIGILFTGNAQSPSMMTWEELLNKPKLAEYFSGIFDDLGIVVNETGEQFTVHHKGDHFTLSEGVAAGQCDYVAHLTKENIDNMKRHGTDSQISEYESYRIMSVMFTPLTEASLKNPWLARPFYRWLAGVENHIQVYLESPTTDEFVVHTLIYINKKWIVIPGAYGNAKRVFKLTPQQGVDYQRKVFEAIKKDSAKDWRKFKKWYLKWRKEVSEKD